MIRHTGLAYAVCLVLIATVLCSPLRSDDVTYVAREHPLFAAERAVRKEKLGDWKRYKHLGLTGEESLEEMYRKLILLRRRSSLFWHNDDDPKGRLLWQYQSFMVEQVAVAHAAYPESSAVTSLLALTGILGARSTVAHAEDKFLTSIACMSLCVQDMDMVPSVAINLHYLMRHARMNCVGRREKELRRMLGVRPGEGKAKEAFGVLQLYWTTKIDPDYSSTFTEAEIEAARRELTPAQRRVAIRLWGTLVRNSYTMGRRMLEAELHKQAAREVNEARARASRRPRARQKGDVDTEERAEATRAKLSVRRLAALEPLEEAPNALAEVYALLAPLAKGDEVKTERIPNYSRIKRALGEAEAELMNALYAIVVHGEHDAGYKVIEALARMRPDDSRLIMLLATNALRQDNYDAARTALERLLAQEPHNWQAQHMLVDVKRTLAEDDATKEETP